MKKTILASILAIATVCSASAQDTLETALANSEGYTLMSQKCYICHFPKPDPAKMNQMIAPPMLRIQEHYKPVYTNKEDFIAAMIDFVNQPSEEKALMPGAIKKFQLMPKLIYDEKELYLIAETLFDIDFGTAPKIRMKMMQFNGIQLNNGEKWKLKPESIQEMETVIKKVNYFEADNNIAAYNQLGREVFNAAKKLMLEDAYTGEKFNQIHTFVYGIENNMFSLMATPSLEEAKKQLSELKIKLKDFSTYFEN